jgi:hypothetical protein
MLEEYGQPLRQYSGLGLLNHNAMSIPVHFECVQLNDGRIYIEVEYIDIGSEDIVSTRSSENISLIGILNDGSSFSSDKLYFIKNLLKFPSERPISALLLADRVIITKEDIRPVTRNVNEVEYTFI